MQTTLQRAVDYQRLYVVQTAGRVTLTVRFQRLFVVQVLLIFVSFNKRCLFGDLCQTKVGRRYDKTNFKW